MSRWGVLVILAFLSGCIAPLDAPSAQAFPGDPATGEFDLGRLRTHGDGAVALLISNLSSESADITAGSDSNDASGMIGLLAYAREGGTHKWRIASIAVGPRADVGLSLDPADWLVIVVQRSAGPSNLTVTVESGSDEAVAIHSVSTPGLSFLDASTAGPSSPPRFIVHNVTYDAVQAANPSVWAGRETIASSHSIADSLVFAAVAAPPSAGLGAASASWVRPHQTSTKPGLLAAPATIVSGIGTELADGRSELTLEIASAAIGSRLSYFHFAIPLSAPLPTIETWDGFGRGVPTTIFGERSVCLAAGEQDRCT